MFSISTIALLTTCVSFGGSGFFYYNLYNCRDKKPYLDLELVELKNKKIYSPKKINNKLFI